MIEALVLCSSDPSKTPRPKRVVELLYKLGHKVDVGGLRRSADLPCREFFQIKEPSNNICIKIFRKLFRSIPFFYDLNLISFYANQCLWGTRSFYSGIKSIPYDVIFVEDIQLLPLALMVRKNAKIILDAREYYPDEIANSALWRFFDGRYKKYICSKYLKRCDFVLTVSPGLQALYKQNFAVDTTLFRSVPSYVERSVRPCRENKIRMVHHGLANRDRCLEGMIDVFDGLDNRFTLDFYLTGDSSYINSLKKRAKPYKNIRFCSPVPFEEIVSTISKYDVGFYLLKNTGVNTTYALPNKLFEFIQGRVAVICGPSPDMADIVKEYNCGFVSKSFKPDSMREMLNDLQPKSIDKAKEGADKAARLLCFEQESAKIIAILEENF